MNNKKYLRGLIRKEAPYIVELLSRMEGNQGNIASAEFFIDGYEIPYLLIENFVLPDRFAKNGYEDHEDILIPLHNHPYNPPFGFYIPTNSPHLSEIKKLFGLYALHDSNGYTWIDFAYNLERWDYNFDNPIKGDCLCKFIESIFLALEGKYLK